jgi:hypothetical protein
MSDYTDPVWVEEIAAWHDNEARLCRECNGPSSPEYADMHETTAAMLRALLAKG